MKPMLSALAISLITLPTFAAETAEKIAYVLKDPSVAQAIDAALADGQKGNQKAWFKGLVISESPSNCKGDRQSFILLYGRTVQANGQAEIQKCSQIVHFGDCNSTTGKVSDVEKAPRCKSAK